MAIVYPEKFELAEKYVDGKWGDLESPKADAPALTNDSRLILYALRQQANVGPCTAPAPWAWQVTERYKHSAWQGLGNMSKPEAMVHYTRHLDTLTKNAWLNEAIAQFGCSEDTSKTIAAAAAATATSAARAKEEQQQQQQQSTLGSDSINIPSSPLPLTATSVAAAAVVAPQQQQQQQSSAAAAGEIDVSRLSDAQVAALLAPTSPRDDGRIEASVGRALVAEVLRLRRALVMASVSGGGAHSVRSGTLSGHAVMSPQKVEHRYYSMQPEQQQQHAAEQHAAASSSSQQNAAAPAAAAARPNNSGGWFFGLFGGGGTAESVQV